MPTRAVARPVTSATPSPVAPLLEMARRLSPVPVERVPVVNAAGRVLAEPLVADRDSPACDVSAMDGFAIRHADWRGSPLAISPSPARIGCPPVMLPPGQAAHIVTGAPLPVGADTVIRCEDLSVRDGQIVIASGIAIERGASVRRRGENVGRGTLVLDSGTLLTPAGIATCAAFGASQVLVHRRVRVAVVVTGDEILPPGQSPEPWQLRDSNGPSLDALLAGLPWIEPTGRQHVPDDLECTVTALNDSLERADAVVMTGGVSMGDRDFAQVAVERIGAIVCFHKLPIRPGKPMLGAITPGGKPIIGLPGNPVSVLVTARRFATILLRRLSGRRVIDPPAATLQLQHPVQPLPAMWNYRTVNVVAPGVAELVAGMGSGDVASAGRGDGVIEIPPLQARDRYAYYPWGDA